MNLGKTAAVLAGAGPVISLFGSQIGNVQTAVEGFGGITTGVLSELGKLPKGFKSATKSAANFQKDFTGSLKGLGSAITGPFQVLTPKLSATVGKIGKVVSGVPGKVGGAVGKIGLEDGYYFISYRSNQSGANLGFQGSKGTDYRG